MKHGIIILISLLINSAVFAQTGIISFDTKKIELGKIEADDVPTTVTYTFKNTGQAPVIISKVNSYLPGVTLEWDRNPIVPGAQSQITLAFVSANVSEKFSYRVNVISNAQNRNENLEFSAQVIDNPKKPYLLYKHNMEGVKFKEQNIRFDNIFDYQTISDTLYFYNTKEEAVTMGVKHTPAYLKVVFNPSTVKAGEKGEMIVTFDAKAKNDYGYTYDNIILNINQSNSYNNRISITAHIKEDFSGIKDSGSVPVASFQTKTIDFGNVQIGKKADCDFMLTNTGKSNLIIRKTKASCGCTAVTLGESTIAPGATTTIRASFDSSGKSGRQHKSITVITNDPINPEINLTITGSVVNS